jgi:hypothetical protein
MAYIELLFFFWTLVIVIQVLEKNNTEKNFSLEGAQQGKCLMTV